MSTNPLHSVSVSGVTFDDAGRVLLIKRQDNGEWQAPGGILELDERFEDGVVREVLEETGVHVEVECLSGIYKNMTRGVVALVFRCRAKAGVPRATSEARQAEWMRVEDGVRLMSTVFAVRIQDAVDLPSDGRFASRAHDGVRML